jgi:hypothetical protein
MSGWRRLTASWTASYSVECTTKQAVRRGGRSGRPVLQTTQKEYQGYNAASTSDGQQNNKDDRAKIATGLAWPNDRGTRMGQCNLCSLADPRPCILPCHRRGSSSILPSHSCIRPVREPGAKLFRSVSPASLLLSVRRFGLHSGCTQTFSFFSALPFLFRVIFLDFALFHPLLCLLPSPLPSPFYTLLLILFKHSFLNS